MSNWFRLKRWNAPAGSELSATQGVSLSYSWGYTTEWGTPVDLTQGYSASLIFKKRPSSGTAVLTCTTGTSRLTLDAVGGITLRLSPAETAGLDVGRLVFELRLTLPDGSVNLLDSGTLQVSS